jgi:hypothetical protein
VRPDLGNFIYRKTPKEPQHFHKFLEGSFICIISHNTTDLPHLEHFLVQCEQMKPSLILLSLFQELTRVFRGKQFRALYKNKKLLTEILEVFFDCTNVTTN